MVPELLDRLDAAGVRLSRSGDELRVRAPKGALTQELRELLRSHRDEIHAYLDSRTAAGIRSTWEGEDTPLSPMQERMWYFSRVGVGAAFNVVAAYRLRGALDHAAMRRAVEHVVARHATLRSHVVEEGGNPRMRYASGVSLELPVDDLSDLPREEALEACRGRIRKEYFHEFDPGDPPLMYVRLFRLGDEDWVLYTNLHHALMDAFSFTVLVRELAASYAAFSSGREPALAPLPIQFPDWILWKREHGEDELVQEELAYWQSVLQPPLDTFDLVPEDQRQSAFELSGSDFPFAVEAPLVARLAKVARAEGATTFMVVMASLKLAIHRLTGSRDVTVGTPVAGRGHPELRPLIGAFLNTVAVRSQVDPDASLRDFLATVRDDTRGALAHQQVPFSEVVRALDLPNDPTRTPVYQVSLNLWDISDRPDAWGDLEAERLHVPTPWTHTEFAMWLMQEGSGRIHGSCTYAATLFEPSTAERLGKAVHQILEAYGQDPDVRVSDVELVTPEERITFAARNDTGVPLEWATVPGRLAAVADEAGDRLAVSQTGAELSYAELDRRARRVAAVLRGQGVERGSVVGMVASRSPEMVVALLATWRAGAAYLPLDPDYPRERLGYMLADAGVERVVAVDATLPSGVETTVVELESLEEAGREISDEELADLPELSGDQLAYVLYTSGSTGRPKGTEVEHRNLANFIASMAREPGFSAEDILLAVTTVSFDIAGLELWLPLCTGGRVEIAREHETRDQDLLRERLQASRATVMQATPASWRMLLRSGWEGGLRAIFCGGETFPRDCTDDLLARADEVWNLYGPTETTVWSTAHRVMRDGPGPVPIGRPIANTSAYVVDEQGRLLPDGIPGELWIGGWGVSRGYRGRPDLTEERFGDGRAHDDERIYRTGDRVRWLRDGTLEHLGRLDTQVQLHGHRIELGEIEAHLGGHPDVDQAVVSVVRTHPGDGRLVAYVVPVSGRPVLGSTLRRSLRDDLPRHMIPGLFVELDRVPLTPAGKVDRSALPDPMVRARSAVAEPPRGGMEEEVATVWADLLPEVDTVCRSDNFFELGGHSLLAIRAVARLAERTGRRLDPRTLFFDDLSRVAAALSAD